MAASELPENVIQGEKSRLFPVLATTSKEGRTTAIVLACIKLVDEFGAALLGGVGERIGARAQLETYTEVVFKHQPDKSNDRPDGLIALKVGKREWTALVEAKVGTAQLSADQIERYRGIARTNSVDAVISISNQFATAPSAHPLEEVRKSRSKIPVFHWSWMHILTTADLLLNTNGVADRDQRFLLQELHRFLTHESAGVRGFQRMPKARGDLNKLVSSGGAIPARSEEAAEVVQAWHQETRDLSLILSRMTETVVTEWLPKKQRNDPAQRHKDELNALRDTKELRSTLVVPGAAAHIEVVADILRRSVDVGMTIRAPEDRKTTKARLNWLLRQIKSDNLTDLHVRLFWPGASEATQFPAEELLEDVARCDEGKDHLVAHGFHVFLSKRLGGRFTQQSNFIDDLEDVVPDFYGRFGSALKAWQKPAPKLRPDTIDQSEETETTEGTGEEG